MTPVPHTEAGARDPSLPVLVTGGAGFIGSHLVERLLADGRRVVVVDDLSTGRESNLAPVARHPGLRTLWSKVSECDTMDTVVAECGEIYHLAAAVGVQLVVNSPIRTIETNLRETQALLAIASRHGRKVLLASTSEVYGKSGKEAFDEADDLLIGPPHLGRWSYACSKLMDEFMAMAYAREQNLPVVVARLFNTVGPRQVGRYGMVLPRFIDAARTGRPLTVYGDGRQSRCFCYVGDAVEALVRLQSSRDAEGRVFNVGSDCESTVLELARLVIDVVGSVSPLEFVPYERAYAPGFEDMMRRRPLLQRLVDTVGFKPATPLRRIIELTAAAVSGLPEERANV
jgi:UDP-glucose 4-epimerase